MCINFAEQVSVYNIKDISAYEFLQMKVLRYNFYFKYYLIFYRYFIWDLSFENV